jgi:hypothetical protein
MRHNSAGQAVWSVMGYLRWTCLILGTLLSIGACSRLPTPWESATTLEPPSRLASPTGSARVPSPAPQPAVGYAGLPIDVALAPISRSAPSEQAEVAMNLCWGLDDTHVVGAALIPAANQALKYAPFMGREPELASTEPIWLFQYQGDWDIRGRVDIDPTCAVIDGVRYFYVGHGNRVEGKAVNIPLPPFPPILALPSLLP